LDVINAISKPEKKAEATNVIKIIRIELSKIMYFFIFENLPVFYVGIYEEHTIFHLQLKR
jgi:hypothetical protein